MRTLSAIFFGLLILSQIACGKPPYVPQEEHPGNQVIFFIKLEGEIFTSMEEKVRWTELEHAMEKEIETAKVADYEGHEVGQGYFSLYYYADDPDAIIRWLRKRVKGQPLLKGTHFTKRLGELVTKESL